MKNRSYGALRPPAVAAAVLGAVIATALSSCARHEDAPATANDTNVRLTDAQRQHIHLFTVAASKYHRTVEANGAVDYDNDQATSVLAPFSGPVSRTLVSPGDGNQAGHAALAGQ